MSRTVTGSYILRPSTWKRKLTSTFSSYFSTDVAQPSGTWTNDADVEKNVIGDADDETKWSYPSISTSQNAYNCVMSLVVEGDVPDVDYTVKSVKVHNRNRATTNTGSSNVLEHWFTIWYGAGSSASVPTTRRSAGHFCAMHADSSTSQSGNSTTTLTTHTSTMTATNTDVPGGIHPDFVALCVSAYRPGGWFPSFTSYAIYDLWFVVEYTYVEKTDVTATVKADSGTAVSGDATVQAGTTANVTFDEGTIVSLTAEPADGYVFDGWYSGGSKVAETTTYSFTISAAVLYAISHKRNLYVGDARVKEVYIGTTKIGEIYSGSEPIWKDSELLAEATGGTT